jgi:hypothetical protein
VRKAIAEGLRLAEEDEMTRTNVRMEKMTRAKLEWVAQGLAFETWVFRPSAALQAARKLCFVSGHDFGRAVKVREYDGLYRLRKTQAFEGYGL